MAHGGNPGKRFPKNTAGSRMISTVPTAKVGQSVCDVGRMLVRSAKNFKTLDYVYVVDGKNVLRGVASIKEILQVPDKRMRIENIMKRNLVVVHPLTHQERVAYIALTNRIKTVPVVDKAGRFLGIVPYDTILGIFNEEVHKDIFKFVGIHHEEPKELDVVKASAKKMIKARIPWIIVGLVGGIIAASVVGFFEDVLSAYLVLVMFMPVLVYMSDAVGTQSETLIVRSMALDPKMSVRNYVLREFKVAAALALVCGAFLAAAAMAGVGTLMFSAVVGLSMFTSILVAVFIATFLPLLLKRFNLDPAVATGPFATVMTDILTLAIYFGIASAIMMYFA